VLSKGNINIVIDTKWKYDSQISMQDVRQIYAYGDYFGAKQNYLMYPDKLENKTLEIKEGNFYEFGSEERLIEKTCSLMYVDILSNGNLNMEIGNSILKTVFNKP
jgi:hypothetical protein